MRRYRYAFRQVEIDVLFFDKLQKNDILIIAGKGHETSQTIGTETLPFDDYTVVKESIKNYEYVRKIT